MVSRKSAWVSEFCDCGMQEREKVSDKAAWLLDNGFRLNPGQQALALLADFASAAIGFGRTQGTKLVIGVFAQNGIIVEQDF